MCIDKKKMQDDGVNIQLVIQNNKEEWDWGIFQTIMTMIEARKEFPERFVYPETKQGSLSPIVFAISTVE